MTLSKHAMVLLSILMGILLLVIGVSAGLVIADRITSRPTKLASADVSQPMGSNEDYDDNRNNLGQTAEEAGQAPTESVDGDGSDQDPYDLQESDNTSRTGKYNTTLDFDPPFNNSPAGVMCAYLYACTRGETERAYGYWLTQDPYARVVSSGIATTDLLSWTASMAGINLNDMKQYKCEVEVQDDLAEVYTYYQLREGDMHRDGTTYGCRKLDGRWKLVSVFVG